MELYLLNINNITQESIDIVKEKMPRRYKKATSFKLKNDFLRSIGSGVLLLKSFNGLDEKDILYNKQGKPYIEGECNFNISHSGDYVVMAKCDGLIGVDIEEINKDHLKVSEKVYQLEEILWMNEEAIKFYILWTMKESVIKALGAGLKMAPKTFSVMPFISNKSIENDGVTLYNKYTKYNNYIVSVSSNMPIDELLIKEI